jgi:peroxiredoxin
MKTSFFLLLYLLLIFCYGCKQEDRNVSELKQFLGSEVYVPENILTNFSRDNKYHLIMYIDTNECMPCHLEKIKLFKYYKNDFEKYQTEIILIAEENDKKSQLLSLLRDMKIDYPLLFSPDHQFLERNRTIRSNSFCRTFVIDNDKKVIWIGNPILSAETIGRYREMMNLLIEVRE